jgi:hypothetical protein
MEHVQVLADFDHTITSRNINGKLNVPTIAVFRESKLLPESFKTKLQDLFNHYFPLVTDPEIKYQEQIVANYEWMEKVNKVFRD